jgi:hypothetical protein
LSCPSSRFNSSQQFLGSPDGAPIAVISQRPRNASSLAGLADAAAGHTATMADNINNFVLNRINGSPLSSKYVPEILSRDRLKPALRQSGHQCTPLWIWGMVCLPHRPFSTTPALGAPPLLI